MNLITTRTLAEKCDTTTKTVRKWHTSGRLGPMPVAANPQLRFNEAEIDAWLAAGMPPRVQWQERMRVQRASTKAAMPQKGAAA